ncbi:VPS10 domain-containing protein [Scytonema sp. PRP1]|uniref:VPS10 domain-containing protein n=1 Tax=Scytonema sp. PRP1 TaxID=3120513 RepID=UPI002FD1FF95
MSDRRFWALLGKTTCIAMIALATAIAIEPLKPTCSTTSGYQWTNVSIGGGGYVTGVYLHPLQQDLVYIRTDIGGFYRWNAVEKRWIPLTDHFGLAKSNYYGGEALALDPNNPNIVYIATGKYTASSAGLGTIFKSTNQGKTWTKLNIDLPMGGNETHRWVGERLAVNPFNSNVIFFGSRLNGLWKSSDAGATWVKVTSFPGKPKADIGIAGIVFHKKVSGLVYANAYGDGIYKSTDAGVTWSKIAGSPSQVNRMALASNSALYVTHKLGVSKYANGLWSRITPTNAKTGFNALSVDPNNPDRVLIAYDQYHQTKDYCRVFQSTDGGATWQQKKYSLKPQVSWWPDWYFGSATSAIEFDPKIPGRVWLTDWFGTWRTDNINVQRSVWFNYEKGHEELVSFALVSPPRGSVLLSGVADVDGFNHNNGLNAYPSTQLGGSFGPRFQDTYSIAYSESDPARMVRVGGHRGNNIYTGATSTDGGLTWKKFSSFPQNTIPLRVAMSATNPNLFVAIARKGQAIRTADGGSSWSKVSGLPNGPKGPWYWGQPLAADKVKENAFYYYNSGKVYRSGNAGASFSIVNSSLPKEDWSMLKTVPRKSGEVWVSLNWNGLYRSTDGGVKFARIAGVERAYLFAIGKPQVGSKIPALYLYGKITGLGEGIFRSLDNGKTWTNIGDPHKPIGDQPNVMEASSQQFGLVFIGTNGRGIYYGTP